MLSFRFRCVDVVALSLVAGSVVTVVAAAGVGRQEGNDRIKCASNLRQIGQAIMLYANENRGAYPRTIAKMDAPPSWGTPYAADKKDVGPTDQANPFVGDPKGDYKPSAAALATRPEPNDVTAALFMLLRTEDLATSCFICPSTTLKPFDFAGKTHSALEWTNFPGKEGLAQHLSYSYQNPYASKKAISSGFKLNNSITAEFAVMADLNPGDESLLKATWTDAASVERRDPSTPTPEQRKLNSLNHGGDGQNVLFGDGHVEFLPTPFVGVQRDNIYVAADGRNGETPEFAASPADGNDSILLPTAKDIEQKPESSSAPPMALANPEEAKVIVGTYAGKMQGRTSKLVIDDKTITATAGPMTVKYDYRVLGKRGGSFVLELTAPETQPMETTLMLTGDTVEFEPAVTPPGHWTREAK